MYKCSLDKLPLNTNGYILNLNITDSLRRRLLDLGLIKDTLIKPVLTSPFGNPRAYQIRGTIIAIRTNEAKNIDVRVEENKLSN